MVKNFKGIEEVQAEVEILKLDRKEDFQAKQESNYEVTQETVEAFMAEAISKARPKFQNIDGVLEVVYEDYHFDSLPEMCYTVDNLADLPDKYFISSGYARRGTFIDGIRVAQDIDPGDPVIRKIDTWIGPGD